MSRLDILRQMTPVLKQVPAARVATVAVLALVATLAARDAAGSPTRGTVSCPPPPRQEPVHLIVRPRWLPGTLVTEYFPVREAWFRGRPVAAPGLSSPHRVDWLYGAHGVAMNGEGIGLDGRVYHFAGPYNLDWVNTNGAATLPCWTGHWTRGEPAWYGGGWRNSSGSVTFPLAGGGWSNGAPKRSVHVAHAATFAPGPSLPLDYWKRVAVDPRLIPLGSRVFISAYCHTPAHGWFTAADVGGAIIARHVDVFRAPPPSLAGLHALWNQTIYIVPPHTIPPRPPRCPP